MHGLLLAVFLACFAPSRIRLDALHLTPVGRGTSGANCHLRNRSPAVPSDQLDEVQATTGVENLICTSAGAYGRGNAALVLRFAT